MEKKKFYITTAIPYTSALPHIGNIYEIILTDAIARFKRLEGYDVYFQTGTDEHGQKIELKAQENGVTPKEYVDNIVSEIKNIFEMVHIDYDNFIRTTDDKHVKQVEKIYKKLHEQGDIYKGHYEGMYCVPCESFYTESQLVDGKCPEHPDNEIVETKEEAYFLNLAKYQERLVEHINSNPEFIQPESRKNEMLNNFLKDKLPDLCVSRTSFDWGVPLEFDKGHVSYVWIDALSNYITGIGFDVDGNHEDTYKKYWPADIHVIGKDILRFHTIYWPVILMALGEELPKQIFGHPWILVGKNKMSKSAGSVLYTHDLVNEYGVDAVRYYVLHETPFAQDGTITHELVMERLNSDLANTLSNLVHRTIKMVRQYFGGEVKSPNVKEEIDQELIDLSLSTKEKVIAKMDELKVSDAMEHILVLLRRTNKYIDETTPWILGKDESKHDRLATVLYNLTEAIRFSSVLLQAFLPETSNKIFEMIKTDKTSFESIETFGNYEAGKSLEEPEPLFKRMDINKKLKELEANVVKKDEVKKVEKPDVEEITIDDFAKLDIRVGLIKECEKHPSADRLLVSQVDVGFETRQIVSGIAKYYKPEELVGKKVLVITNLKPIKLRGVLSQGMILAGSNKKQLEVITSDILKPGDEVN